VLTGLVEDLGRIEAVDSTADGVRLRIATRLADQIAAGDSIAVDGVCLTATQVTDASFAADVMHETLRRSALGDAVAGGSVNLELALRADGRLGGHFVLGHVDAVGAVSGVEEDGFARRVTISAPEEILRYVVEKGSIAVNGVSLTVAAVDDDAFAVSLIPETLERTTLGRATQGARVNLEADMLAKHLEKLVVR
jgi:riboflavin synthase